MQKLLQKIVPLRSGEGRAFFYCFAINLLLGLTYVIGNSVTDALFLKNFGAEYLAPMFAIKAGIVMAAFPVYNYFSDRFDSHRIFLGLSLLFTGLLSLIGGVLLLPTPPALTYPVLLIINALFSALVFTHFATYLINFFDTQQSKRLLPSIFSAVILGTMFGGFALPTLLRLSGSSSLLIFGWGTLLLLISLLINFNKKNSTLKKAYVGVELEEGFFQSFKKNFDIIGRSRFIQLTLLAYFFGDLALSGADIISHTIFAASPRFPDADSLTAFYGVLEGWIAIAALVLEFLFVPRLIRYLGVSALNFVLPTLLALGFVGLAFASPALVFTFAIIARFNVQAISEYLEPTASNLILNALTPEQKRKVFGLYGGFMEPLGPVVTGLILAGLALFLPITKLAPLFLGFGLGYLLLTYFQNRAYARELVDLLESQNFDLFKNAAAGSQNLNPAVFAKLEANLVGPDADTAIISAELLAELRGTAALPALLATFRDSKPQSKTTLLQLFGKLGEKNPAILEAALASITDPDAGIRKTALTTLDVLDTANTAIEKVTSLLADADITVAALAAAYLLDREAAAAHHPIALAKLQEFFVHGNHCYALAALTALATIRKPTPEILELILNVPETPQLLRKKSGKTLLAILAATADLNAFEQVTPLLREKLESPVRELRLAALEILIRLKKLANAELLLVLGDRSEKIRARAREFALAEKIFTVAELAELQTKTENHFLWKSALLLAAETQNEAKGEKLALVNLALRTAGKYLSELVCLEKRHHNDDNLLLLKTILNDRLRFATDTAISLLAYLSRDATVTTIQKSLRSHDTRLRASALETLEHLPVEGIGKTVRLFDPLTCGLAATECLRLFREAEQIPNCSTETIYADTLRSEDPWEQSIAREAATAAKKLGEKFSASLEQKLATLSA